ncbi:hypothetical protein MHM95_12515 [Pseudoalteromonas sp. CnMc7-15]|uniref:hypothetical protein n=1 Tax=unclassified Pseudoalteromonas TaxID=194690 RepID=UPI001EF59E3F|nr:hypothetical protein [Pseudoalteromonas sp. CnMc7-15]MCG7567104.1 hypothetical protein [Pseudoalteromonas sp. CnMc7-15]
MDNQFTWKKFQFITAVQTALINNAINRSLDDDAKDNRHNFSAISTLAKMDDAFYAAERIPEDKTANDAAFEFIGHNCVNGEEPKGEIPYWFRR